jgi:hypothetical protein
MVKTIIPHRLGTTSPGCRNESQLSVREQELAAPLSKKARYL